MPRKIEPRWTKVPNRSAVFASLQVALGNRQGDTVAEVPRPTRANLPTIDEYGQEGIQVHNDIDL